MRCIFVKADPASAGHWLAALRFGGAAMRSLGRSARLSVLGVVSAPIAARAQVEPVTVPPSASAASSGAGPVTMIAALGGLSVSAATAAKLYALKRKREADAVHLQAQLSDALLREPSLFG